jgi:hypothetical protein
MPPHKRGDPLSQREAVEERADARHGRTLTRPMLALHSVKSLVAEQGRSSVARTPHFTRTIGRAVLRCTRASSRGSIRRRGWARTTSAKRSPLIQRSSLDRPRFGRAHRQQAQYLESKPCAD